MFSSPDSKSSAAPSRSRKRRLWRLVAGLSIVVAFWGLSSPAHANTLDIKVSINASKSLSAGTTTYDYGAQTVNASTVSATAIVITNNSGALVETYTLQGANAASTQGGTTWTLASSTGTDQYALAAEFSNAAPTNVAANWASDDLTTSVVACSATQFGNGTAGESGAAVVPAATRNLWFRLRTPGTVSDTTQHLAVVTLAVQ